MISAEENVILTRVGRGTPMGNLMRQFWIPACLSSELIADGDPTRLMLLGEKLIAFRDTAGRVGIFDHRCPHRCASLFFGRNEEGGIRCAYHGWKFDVDGNCLDQPNVPDKNRYPAGTKAYAYQVTERGGLVFLYMGEKEVAPPLPDLEPTMVDTKDKGIALTQRDCNWLQALEGDVDTSHVGFLHVGKVDGEQIDLNDPARYTVINKDPIINVTETDYGTMYSAQRDADENKEHHRFASFIFPFWVTYPSDMLANNVSANAWVPIDDEHTMIFNIDVYRGTGKDTTLYYRDGTEVPGLSRPLDYRPRTDDWMGRWRPTASRANDYYLDREMQRNGSSYTGIVGITMQDQAIQESMGAIVDRSLEHLASSDRMVMLTRRALLKAAIDYRDTGKLPRIVEEPHLCRDARGGDIVVQKGTDWLDAYENAMNSAVGPLHGLKAAE
ncbi:Rieske 2Fe-2S domain-containing protein [Beijerinckia sp. L45]|uniref:Rieske 2Fe-2S domain-containing protein n=1 Tax=Beijerinckia sp. L45 TaxID=1641855 RepID=UPI001AEDDD55|nr:Rieske 2Fe-2S domain-containing protein [Beijerinckia sp. L45]